MRRQAARGWLARWEAMQARYVYQREPRFEAMGEILEAMGKGPRRILDLGCGPGSLSLRLLRRFPGARVVAVDQDPVLLQLGRSAWGDFGGRLEWVDEDLRRAPWGEGALRGPFDAAVSTTALHWLTTRELRKVYAGVARVLRPGGGFLNGDSMPFGPSAPTLDSRVRAWTHRVYRSDPTGTGGESWTGFWRAISRVEELNPELEERVRRYPSRHSAENHLRPPEQVRLLRAAGFREAEVLWQAMSNRVLVALR